MTLYDTLSLSFKAITSYRTRSLLIILAMALGVAAVIMLTALGDGARQYVANQFSSIGTNLIIVMPGRAETSGAFLGAALGQTPRDLTLKDAQLLGRLPQIRRYAPLNVGAIELSAANRLREVTVLGSTADLIPIRHMNLAQGHFLSQGSEHSAQIVLGAKLAHEFFPRSQAIGQRVRLGERRFLVSGVLASQGESMGYNTDEIVIIPIEHAQALFNTSSLFRILIEAKSSLDIQSAKQAIQATLKQSHDGEDDITVITQDAVLKTFDRILRALTLAVAGIAAISLAVAGILVMNVMLVAVSQRTSEIGLLKAIGASAADIRHLFFAEALWLSLAGASIGFLLGQLGSLALRLAYPQLPAWAPVWASLAGISVALLTGILASLFPARRAARLDAVTALNKK
ncbi:putative ABC transport system permease protein [Nitrosomonas cryotolerans]|uniref:Putative ABC transport system permease protein n=1 Tax=Nitrosomonas cryotolerans ATCC 49181 TaxID=1131553 RepID=A0A1N6JHV2_9PROT|nr:ABC transporter permease [Nitrosomonas cryotolerans]SFP88869.1 putative ABC transport system permease protein [Nitrosomonas cryotolerans]SIO43905.1 putative ABC transport system permease protein [Nitrosomonas cryotolerans ATCC 49181]